MKVDIGREPGTSHADAAGVCSADSDGQVRDNFAKARWPVANIECEVVEIANGIVHGPVDPDPMFIGLFEARLESAEETAAAGNSKDHTAQFAQSFVPVFVETQWRHLRFSSMSRNRSRRCSGSSMVSATVGPLGVAFC